MSAKHVLRHGELENRLARPQQFFPCSESASASPTCSDSASRNPRAHALPTKHINSMLAVPPPSSPPSSCLHSAPNTPSVSSFLGQLHLNFVIDLMSVLKFIISSLQLWAFGGERSARKALPSTATSCRRRRHLGMSSRVPLYSRTQVT
jgi:hypothetical protein